MKVVKEKDLTYFVQLDILNCIFYHKGNFNSFSLSACEYKVCFPIKLKFDYQLPLKISSLNLDRNMFS